MRTTLLAAIALSVSHAGSALTDPPPSQDSSHLANAPPVSVGGCWDFVIEMPFLHPNMRGQFAFTVEDRVLRGTATLHGDAFPLRDGTVNGNRVRFSVERSGDRLTFEGKLKKTELEGKMTKSGEQRSWTATRCRSK